MPTTYADATHLTPPSRLWLLLEGRAFSELGAYFATLPALRRMPKGDGHVVLVLPGLGASDRSTVPMRRFLRGQGYDARPWDQGRNLGLKPGLFDRLHHLLDDAYDSGKGKVSLIGWSLGGTFARELAKQAPDLVRQVITLGSPFTRSPRASHAWRAYEWFAGHRVDEIEIVKQLPVPPPVPTTSIYSRTDGIVAWRASRNPPAAQCENIEIDSSHFGMGHHPLALAAIADRLAQPEGAWAPFARTGWRANFYRDPDRPAGFKH